MQHVVINDGRFLSRDVDTDLPHDLNRTGILAVCLDTCGLHHDSIATDMPRPAFGDLRAAGIAGAKEQNIYRVRHRSSPVGCSFLSAVACLGETSQGLPGEHDCTR